MSRYESTAKHIKPSRAHTTDNTDNTDNTDDVLSRPCMGAHHAEVATLKYQLIIKVPYTMDHAMYEIPMKMRHVE